MMGQDSFTEIPEKAPGKARRVPAAAAALLRRVFARAWQRDPESGNAGDRALAGEERSTGLLKKNFTLTFNEKGLVRRHRLGNAATLIGRARTCHVRISRPEVAPVHCRLERASDGGLVLFSESDGHPVLVDGSPVEFKRLDGGETISIGPVAVKVRSALTLGGGEGTARSDFTFENHFGRAMVRSIKRSHWLGASCILHLILIFTVSWLLENTPAAAERVGFFQNGFGESLVDFPLSEEDAGIPGRYEFDEPAESSFEAPEDLAVKTPLPGEEPIDTDQFGPFGKGGEGLDADESAVIGKILNPGGGDAAILGGGKGWSEHVGRLRSTGLDVAILFDSTGSMVRLITEVKSTITDMVKALDRIVPDLRISLITYKGTPEASRYVIAKTPLVNDVFELLNFMSSVEISGGSAEGYAAIDKAVHTAVNNLSWRKGTRRAIVIIGDAAPFPDTHDDALKQIRKFKGTLSAIYKSSEQTPGYLEPETIAAFRKFARAGKGEFIQYDEEGEVARRIVSAVLGSEWEEQIDLVFDYEESGRWQRILDRRAENGDVDWLMKQFIQKRLRPEVADALVSVGGEEVAARIWDILRKESGTPWIIQRCIYVLRRLTNLHVDYMQSSRERLSPRQLGYIWNVLTFVYGRKFDK